MYTLEQPLQAPSTSLVVGFDVEWTKDYRVSDGSRPFCFSFVYLTCPSTSVLTDDTLSLGFILVYIEQESEAVSLVEAADRYIGELMKTNTVLVGHQLSSDLGVLLRNSGQSQPTHLIRLRDLWKCRKRLDPGPGLTVFDTRYDLESSLHGKSRRLVDVCLEYGFEVTQPEIRSSMTKMQREFAANQDRLIREKLSVVNIRHSLSSALLYLSFRYTLGVRTAVNVNRILYRHLKDHWGYIRSGIFQTLI